MTTYIATWVRRQPILTFYLLAFAITWASWLPQAAHTHGLFPFDSPLFYLLGGVGPLLAAFIVLRLLRGAAGDAELFAPLLRGRVGFGWYLVALVGPAMLGLAASGLSGSLGAAREQPGAALALLPVFLRSLLAAVPEEVAWRGFVLPRLQARHSALVASLIIGSLAALWHLPLLLNANNLM
jgi:membrane protease YdiL (CAAX protease family)